MKTHASHILTRFWFGGSRGPGTGRFACWDTQFVLVVVGILDAFRCVLSVVHQLCCAKAYVAIASAGTFCAKKLCRDLNKLKKEGRLSENSRTIQNDDCIKVHGYIG